MDFKKAIEDNGIKQKWVAKKIGISHVVLNYYLNGTREMPESVRENLMTLFATRFTQKA